MDCSLPDSSVHGILQASILEWVAISLSRRFSQPRDHTCFSCIGRQILQFSSVAQSCPTLCNPMNRSTPGLPVHHQLPEFTQTHVSSLGIEIYNCQIVQTPELSRQLYYILLHITSNTYYWQSEGFRPELLINKPWATCGYCTFEMWLVRIEMYCDFTWLRL